MQMTVECMNDGAEYWYAKKNKLQAAKEMCRTDNLLYKCSESKHCWLCNVPGNIQTVPIGYISSCFSVKNGTPRQPTICGPSRAELRIQQSVFNNPEHALLGLEHYSHVW